MPTGPTSLHEYWCNNGTTTYGDVNAQEYLRTKGYRLNVPSYTWTIPEGHTPTELELSAVDYLILEWDFAGFEPPPRAEAAE